MKGNISRKKLPLIELADTKCSLDEYVDNSEDFSTSMKDKMGIKSRIRKPRIAPVKSYFGEIDWAKRQLILRQSLDDLKKEEKFDYSLTQSSHLNSKNRYSRYLSQKPSAEYLFPSTCVLLRDKSLLLNIMQELMCLEKISHSGNAMDAQGMISIALQFIERTEKDLREGKIDCDDIQARRRHMLHQEKKMALRHRRKAAKELELQLIEKRKGARTDAEQERILRFYLDHYGSEKELQTMTHEGEAEEQLEDVRFMEYLRLKRGGSAKKRDKSRKVRFSDVATPDVSRPPTATRSATSGDREAMEDEYEYSDEALLEESDHDHQYGRATRRLNGNMGPSKLSSSSFQLTMDRIDTLEAHESSPAVSTLPLQTSRTVKGDREYDIFHREEDDNPQHEKTIIQAERKLREKAILAKKRITKDPVVPSISAESRASSMHHSKSLFSLPDHAKPFTHLESMLERTGPKISDEDLKAVLDKKKAEEQRQDDEDYKVPPQIECRWAGMLSYQRYLTSVRLKMMNMKFKRALKKRNERERVVFSGAPDLALLVDVIAKKKKKPALSAGHKRLGYKADGTVDMTIDTGTAAIIAPDKDGVRRRPPQKPGMTMRERVELYKMKKKQEEEEELKKRGNIKKGKGGGGRIDVASTMNTHAPLLQSVASSSAQAIANRIHSSLKEQSGPQVSKTDRPKPTSKLLKREDLDASTSMIISMSPLDSNNPPSGQKQTMIMDSTAAAGLIANESSSSLQKASFQTDVARRVGISPTALRLAMKNVHSISEVPGRGRILGGAGKGKRSFTPRQTMNHALRSLMNNASNLQDIISLRRHRFTLPHIKHPWAGDAKVEKRRVGGRIAELRARRAERSTTFGQSSSSHTPVPSSSTVHPGHQQPHPPTSTSNESTGTAQQSQGTTIGTIHSPTGHASSFGHASSSTSVRTSTYFSSSAQAREVVISLVLSFSRTRFEDIFGITQEDLAVVAASGDDRSGSITARYGQMSSRMSRGNDDKLPPLTPTQLSLRVQVESLLRLSLPLCVCGDVYDSIFGIVKAENDRSASEKEDEQDYMPLTKHTHNGIIGGKDMLGQQDVYRHTLHTLTRFAERGRKRKQEERDMEHRLGDGMQGRDIVSQWTGKMTESGQNDSKLEDHFMELLGLVHIPPVDSVAGK
ncbi:hypothetical protein ADUPG1_011302, partial [Aduncisulcus paluster]